VRFCQSFMEELYRHIGPNQAPVFVCTPCLLTKKLVFVESSYFL
jgi:glutamate dehydrogenase/leucine dehydrogenase